MAWESRERGGRYYTRSRREDGRVIREYVGGGLAGQMAAESDRITAERRVLEAALLKREREHLEALSAPVLALSEAAEILAHAHLIAAGCHRHKEEYRRARSA